MGLGGELPVASTLVSESVEAHERGKIVVLLESFWAGGWLIAALISYFVIPKYGWEVAMVLSAVPKTICFIFKMEFTGFPKVPKS